MRVRHPHQDRGTVDLGDRLVTVDDGAFEAPASFVEQWCDRNGYDLADVRVDDTCQVVKSDGEVCGRDRPCQYHDDD